MDILAISLDAYGDQVLRQPLLSALLDAGHAITVVVRRAYADIVPFLDTRLSVLACDVDTEAGRAKALERIGRARPQAVMALAFNRTPFDNTILRACKGASRFALIDASPAPETLVEGNGHERPATIDAIAAEIEHPVPVSVTARERVKNRALFRAVAGRATRLSRPALNASPAFAGIAAPLLQARSLEPSRYVVMAGVRPGTVKTLPTEVAVDSIVWLEKEHGLRTLLTGSPSESAALERIAGLARERGAQPEIYIGAAGRIGELLALVRASRAYVGGDTGTMHFAGALGKPVAALFGGGSFPRFEPEAHHWFATTKRLLCFGCGWRCIYGQPRCIREIDAPTWFDGIRQLLDGGSPGWVFMPGSIDHETAEAARGEFRAVVDVLATVERDRSRRLEDIEVLTRRVGELETALPASEADRAQRLEDIESLNLKVGELESSLLAVERDRAQRLDAIHNLTAQVTELQDLLRTSEIDRAARLEIINRQATELELLESAARDRLALLESSKTENDRLVRELAIVNADREARLRVIEQQHELNVAYERAAAERIAGAEDRSTQPVGAPEAGSLPSTLR